MSRRTWVRSVVLFFAWGFVVHGAGLLLHELGGHAALATMLGCGIDGVDLTYFGHGVVHYAPCTRWTWARIVVVDWAGLVLTIAAGAVATAFAHKTTRAPMARLLLGVVGTAFLLGQLAYATSGGFHDLYDPGRTARALGARGLHALAWIPPFALFAASAFAGSRAVVDAFRDAFAPRSRLAGLGQLVATLGVAGLLYFVAFRIEWAWRADVAMRGVAYEAARVAAARHAAPPFPIERVLVAVAVAAFALALARPLRRAVSAEPAVPTPAVPTRILHVVLASALACAATIAAAGPIVRACTSR